MFTVPPTRVPAARRATWFDADSCGCASAAYFMLCSFAIGAGWFAWHHADYSAGQIVMRLTALTFASAVAGKALGLLSHLARRGKPQQHPRARRHRRHRQHRR